MHEVSRTPDSVHEVHEVHFTSPLPLIPLLPLTPSLVPFIPLYFDPPLIPFPLTPPYSPSLSLFATIQAVRELYEVVEGKPWGPNEPRVNRLLVVGASHSSA